LRAIEQPEKYLPPKEIAFEMKARLGIVVSTRYVRDMIRAGVPSLGLNARFSDVVAWWESHKDFAPRSKRAADKLAA
jgi:hypothetical protein